jgi:hypothetical protein
LPVILAIRAPVRNSLIADNGLRAYDALREGRRRNEKCPGNLLCFQAANFTQRERHLSFRRQSGMAAGKDETEAVVLDSLILVRRLVDARFEAGLSVRCRSAPAGAFR